MPGVPARRLYRRLMNPESFPGRKVVFDFHANHRRLPGEAVDHDADQGPVTKADDVGDVDGVEQMANFFGGQYRSLAFLDHVLGATN